MKNNVTEYNYESIKSFIFKTKKLWFYLIILLVCFLTFIYQLWEKDYLSQKIILSKKMPIEIIDLRQSVISSAIIKSDLDKLRVYEVNLGYFCKPDKKLIGTYIEMDLVLYKRNYNQTYFMDFPQAIEKICI